MSKVVIVTSGLNIILYKAVCSQWLSQNHHIHCRATIVVYQAAEDLSAYTSEARFKSISSALVGLLFKYNKVKILLLKIIYMHTTTKPVR